MNRAPLSLENVLFFARERDKAADAALGDLRRLVAQNVNRQLQALAGRAVASPRVNPDEIVYCPETDSYRRLGESDDTTPIATPYPAARIAQHRRFSDAEAEFAKVCDDETGMAVSPEEWERQKAERSEIRRQSHVLAHMLETAGVVAYRDDAFQLWIWHVHSLTAEKIPNFRRICFLPYVAAMVRSSKLAALEFFLQRHPFSRFWTFTSGQRVGIDELGERVSELTGRLNTLNKELIRRYGVEIIFRSTELGSVEFDAALRPQADPGSIEFDEKGDPLFHVHAHCVVHSRVGYITPKKWDEMIAWVWSHWGDHWDAGKIIRDARECCKYVTKPGDMLKLTAPQLARVEAQLHGKRIVAALGTLRVEIKARREAGKCLRRKRTRDGMIWREAFDHNKHFADDLAEQEADFARYGAAADCAEHVSAWNRWKAKGRHAAADMKLVAEPMKKAAAAFCRVLARLAPAAGPRRVKEPRVIVGGTFLDRSAIMNHPLVTRLWSQTVQAFEAGRAISVHTGTPTGETDAMEFMAEVAERLEPPEKLALAGLN